MRYRTALFVLLALACTWASAQSLGQGAVRSPQEGNIAPALINLKGLNCLQTPRGCPSQEPFDTETRARAEALIAMQAKRNDGYSPRSSLRIGERRQPGG